MGQGSKTRFPAGGSSRDTKNGPSSLVHVYTALALFAVVLSIGVFSLSARTQLGMMGGMAEEYVALGRNLAATGTLSFGGHTPTVFRPPGYPCFIAAVIKLHGLATGTSEYSPFAGEAWTWIEASQVVLLGLSSVALYVWLASELNRFVAAGAAVAFGCNPYQQVLAGFLHYETLHTFLAILGLLVLTRCFKTDAPRTFLHATCGVIWGLATLTRPITLVLPFFVCVGYLLSSNGVSVACKKTLRFCLGMALVILPYTARNYAITQRFIPVNAQGNIQLWASTHMELPRSPNEFRWWRIWNPDGESVYRRVVGKRGYSSESYVQHVLELEDEFGRLAKENLARKPSIYLHNVFWNAATFLLDMNPILLEAFMNRQQQNPMLDKVFMQVNARLAPSPMRRVFDLEVLLLTICSLGGLVAGLVRRDAFVLAPLAVFACFMTVHSLSYMDLFYYYIKVPVLVSLSAYFLHAILCWRMPGGRLVEGLRPAVVLGGACLALTGILLAGVILRAVQ